MALTAAYSFDETGLTVVDYSGNDNNFTQPADFRVPEGHHNGGLQPSATVDLPNIGISPNRTVMMWLKGDLAESCWPIQWNVASLDSGAWGIVHIGGNIAIQARNASDLVRAEVPWPADGNWHHVAGTFDGSVVRLYLDGELLDSAPLAGPLRTDSDAPRMFDLAGTATLDCLRIYDNALDATAVATAMTIPVNGRFAESATLAVDAAFIGRVTAAVQRTAVTIGQGVLAAPEPTASDKLRLKLAREALANAAAYGEQFAWAVASDGAVDAGVTDDLIAQKVAAVWDLIAGVSV